MKIDLINKKLIDSVNENNNGTDISYRFLVRVLTAANAALKDGIAEDAEINQALKDLAENLLIMTATACSPHFRTAFVHLLFKDEE